MFVVAVDGNYTHWSNWTACSATCGEGTTTRTRSCTNPSPLHGGRDCTEIGPNIEIQPCKEQDCLGNYSVNRLTSIKLSDYEPVFSVNILNSKRSVAECLNRKQS